MRRNRKETFIKKSCTTIDRNNQNIWEMTDNRWKRGNFLKNSNVLLI